MTVDPFFWSHSNGRSMYDDIVRLIHEKRVAFGTGGVTASKIDEAERALGVPFPPSYRWWLLKYAGGQIGGDIVLGIDPEGLGPGILRIRSKRGNRLKFYMGNAESFFFRHIGPKRFRRV